MANSNQIVEAARQWVRRGYFPVPVPFREKGPKLKNWQNLRLTESELQNYFNGAKSNVGVLLGEPNGNADVDVDCPEALSAWSELGLPTGLVFGRKSKRASHYFYKSTPPVRTIKYEDAGKVTLIELRGLKADKTVGLQTCVPPSAHPSGEPIRFEAGYDGEPATIDAAVLEQAVARTAAAALLARHWPAEGAGRHDAFLALSGALAHARWPLAEAVAFLRAIYAALWPGHADFAAAEREVETTFRRFDDGHEVTGLAALSQKIDRQALAKAARWLNLRPMGGSSAAPETWEDPIPFRGREVPSLRVERIPGALGDMVAATAQATETPVELAALLGLAVTSCCLAKKAIVVVEPGYTEPTHLYTAPAMESGNRKTAVFKHMTRPLMDFEFAEAKRLAPEIKRATSERKTMEARIEALRKRAAKSPANTTVISEIAELEANLSDPPKTPRLWVQDVTPEELAVQMAQQGERIALLSDEGGIFDILAGRYSKGVPNLDLFLQAHDGGAVRVDRGSRPPVFLQNPALTVGLSPQPDVLEHLSDTPGFRGRGLLARFLYALPASPLGNRELVPRPCPYQIGDAYRQLIERLLQLTPPICQETWQPWNLKLSPGAYERWKAFQREVEGLMKEGAKLQRLRDWASKLPGAAARVAGVFHCVAADLTENVVIADLAMEQAIDLVTPLIGHALAVFDLMERDKTTEDAQKILGWIRREGRSTFTLRDCFHAHQARFQTVDAIRPPLSVLVGRGYIRQAPRVQVAHRPSETYEVHPKALEVTR